MLLYQKEKRAKPVNLQRKQHFFRNCEHYVEKYFDIFYIAE